MHDGEHGITVIEQRLDRSCIDGFVRRKPAATYHPNDAQPVRMNRLQHVQGQGGAELSSVNDVLGPFEIGIGLSAGIEQGRQDQAETKESFHRNWIEGWAERRGFKFRDYRGNTAFSQGAGECEGEGVR